MEHAQIVEATAVGRDILLHAIINACREKLVLMNDPDEIPDTPIDEFEKELEQLLHEPY